MRRGLADLIDRPDSWMTSDFASAYQAWWRNVPLHEGLLESVRRTPEATAVVSIDREGRRRQLDYRSYDELSRRIAGGLAARGLGLATNIAVMLPNRHEFGAAIFAIKRLGGVYTGIPVSYRQREISYIVDQVQAEAVIMVGRHGRTDLVSLVESALGADSRVRHVFVLDPPDDLPDDPRWETFDHLIAGDPFDDRVVVDPTAICHIGFTSGTTGEPKGVMNTHNSLDTVLRAWIAHVAPESLGSPPIALVPSPVGHHSGYLWGVLMMAYLGGTAVFMEVWDPKRALEIIESERVTTMLVAPTFVQDLAGAAEEADRRPTSLSLVAIAGAPIPRSLVPWASDWLACFICPSWGMTEWGVGISAHPGMAAGLTCETDGVSVDPCEVRVVSELGDAVIGSPGELQMRGPGLFVGYHNRPQYTIESVDPAGWFRTGDVASVASDGAVTLEGRIKDVIIRGGLNIPVRELEDLIYRHPAVREVAVVAIPDERLGERACAFAVLGADASMDLSELVAFLTTQGLSKHYMPERLEILAELPKTMSGKIRKVDLRQAGAALSPDQ